MPVFGLSARSRSNLRGVHPDLIKVVERAIQITTEDFRVQEGLRTRERWRRRSLQRHINEFRIAHVQRSDGWIETTWSNMSDPVRSQRQKPKSRKAATRHRLQAPVWSSA